jgi:hypothetical protein
MSAQLLGPAKDVFDKLPRHMQRDIEDWMEDRSNRVLYDKNDVLDAWLEWNGIIGYGDQMRSMFEALK